VVAIAGCDSAVTPPDRATHAVLDIAVALPSGAYVSGAQVEATIFVPGASGKVDRCLGTPTRTETATSDDNGEVLFQFTGVGETVACVDVVVQPPAALMARETSVVVPEIHFKLNEAGVDTVYLTVVLEPLLT